MHSGLRILIAGGGDFLLNGFNAMFFDCNFECSRYFIPECVSFTFITNCVQILFEGFERGINLRFKKSASEPDLPQKYLLVTNIEPILELKDQHLDRVHLKIAA